LDDFGAEPWRVRVRFIDRSRDDGLFAIAAFHGACDLSLLEIIDHPGDHESFLENVADMTAMVVHGKLPLKLKV